MKTSDLMIGHITGRKWWKNDKWTDKNPGQPSALKITVTKGEVGGRTKWKEEIVAMYEEGQPEEVITEEHEVSS